GARRALPLPPERGRQHPGAVRGLAHPPRLEDPASPHGAARRERSYGRPFPRVPPPGRARRLPLPRLLPPGRSRPAAAAERRRQQRNGGGMIALEVKGGSDAGIRVMNAVRLCSLAENLGAVETLITHPASMTHASIPPEERAAIGIAEGLVRLSVGLEDPEDL